MKLKDLTYFQFLDSRIFLTFSSYLHNKVIDAIVVKKPNRANLFL